MQCLILMALLKMIGFNLRGHIGSLFRHHLLRASLGYEGFISYGFKV